jgi:GTP-binding protein
MISMNRFGAHRIVGGISRLIFQPIGLSQGRAISAAKNYDPSKIRNCAIIAHVDHGKTTLMDKLLQHCGSAFTGERAMDSNDHEKERGITIVSKYTRLHYKEHVLHVVDTPGHADFSGEVERIMSMVDGVVLLVDASEGPMSQTKFVLSKALASNKKAIVVLNKIDREGHRAQDVQNGKLCLTDKFALLTFVIFLEIFDLFCNLTSNEQQLEYPLLYASARQGWVSDDISVLPGRNGVVPLLDAIIKQFSPASDTSRVNQAFAMSVNTIQTDNHLGRIVTGKIESGVVKVGDRIKVMSRDGNILFPESRCTKLFYLQGLNRVDVEEAHAGEIISLAGCEGGVADTICAPDVTSPVETIPISPPVISMTIGPNDSPLAGREGTKLTSNMIKDRLRKEVENNVTLTLRPSSNMECVDVQGRGELQIGILIETMRREGFEMTVSPPFVLAILDKDGKTKLEPFEEVVVDIDSDLQGIAIDSMSNRKGVLKEFKELGDKSRLIFHAPSRGLLGFRNEVMGATRGNATVNSAFSHYAPFPHNQLTGLKKGKIVSMETGKAIPYALATVEERGELFIKPGDEVYEGMVIGESARGGEITVNPCKEKKLTNMRSTGAEEQVRLQPPKKMTVEEIISYMDEDEVIEVTPRSIRLRKKILATNARTKAAKSSKPSR